jgi:hypothetical protein
MACKKITDIEKGKKEKKTRFSTKRFRPVKKDSPNQQITLHTARIFFFFFPPCDLLRKSPSGV